MGAGPPIRGVRRPRGRGCAAGDRRVATQEGGSRSQGLPAANPQRKIGSSTVPTEAGLDSAQKGSNSVMTYKMVAMKASQDFGQSNAW